MSKWKVSTCINEFVFDFSGLIVNGKNKREALEDYIDRLKDELNNVNIDEVLNNEDGCIWEVVDE